jgi:hypothetical protein
VQKWFDQAELATDRIHCIATRAAQWGADQELEAGATCPHVRSSDEGTSYCALAEAVAAPQPPLFTAEEVVPVAVSDALIKAECALSDIAEGEPECNDGDPSQWAEQRCAETLAIIRPVMKLHKIRTSEWPPQPMPTPANNIREEI